MKNNTMKRVLAGTLAVLTVAAYVPANVGGFLTGSTNVVANAQEGDKFTLTWDTNKYESVQPYLTSITVGDVTYGTDDIKKAVSGYNFATGQGKTAKIVSTVPLTAATFGVYTKDNDQYASMEKFYEAVVAQVKGTKMAPKTDATIPLAQALAYSDIDDKTLVNLNDGMTTVQSNFYKKVTSDGDDEWVLKTYAEVVATTDANNTLIEAWRAEKLDNTKVTGGTKQSGYVDVTDIVKDNSNSYQMQAGDYTVTEENNTWTYEFVTAKNDNNDATSLVLAADKANVQFKYDKADDVTATNFTATVDDGAATKTTVASTDTTAKQSANDTIINGKYVISSSSNFVVTVDDHKVLRDYNAIFNTSKNLYEAEVIFSPTTDTTTPTPTLITVKELKAETLVYTPTDNKLLVNGSTVNKDTVAASITASAFRTEVKDENEAIVDKEVKLDDLANKGHITYGTNAKDGVTVSIDRNTDLTTYYGAQVENPQNPKYAELTIKKDGAVWNKYDKVGYTGELKNKVWEYAVSGTQPGEVNADIFNYKPGSTTEKKGVHFHEAGKYEITTTFYTVDGNGGTTPQTIVYTFEIDPIKLTAEDITIQLFDADAAGYANNALVNGVTPKPVAFTAGKTMEITVPYDIAGEQTFKAQVLLDDELMDGSKAIFSPVDARTIPTTLASGSQKFFVDGALNVTKTDNVCNVTVKVYDQNYGATYTGTSATDPDATVKPYEIKLSYKLVASAQEPVIEPIDDAPDLEDPVTANPLLVVAQEDTDPEIFEEIFWNNFTGNEVVEKNKSKVTFEYLPARGKTAEDDDLDSRSVGFPTEKTEDGYTLYVCYDGEPFYTVDVKIVSVKAHFVPSTLDMTYGDQLDLDNYTFEDSNGKALKNIKLADLTVEYIYRAEDKDGTTQAGIKNGVQPYLDSDGTYVKYDQYNYALKEYDYVLDQNGDFVKVDDILASADLAEITYDLMYEYIQDDEYISKQDCDTLINNVYAQEAQEVAQKAKKAQEALKALDTYEQNFDNSGLMTVDALEELTLPAGTYIIKYRPQREAGADYTVTSGEFILTVQKKAISADMFYIKEQVYDGSQKSIDLNTDLSFKYETATGKTITQAIEGVLYNNAKNNDANARHAREAKFTITDGQKSGIEVGRYDVSIKMKDNSKTNWRNDIGNNFVGTADLKWSITYKNVTDDQDAYKYVNPNFVWSAKDTTLYDEGRIHVQFSKRADANMNLPKGVTVAQYGVVVDNKGLIAAPEDLDKNYKQTTTTNYEKGKEGLNQVNTAYGADLYTDAVNKLQLGNGLIEGKASDENKAKNIYGANIKVSNVETGIWARPYILFSDGSVKYGEPVYVDITREAMKNLQVEFNPEKKLDKTKTNAGYNADVNRYIAYAKYEKLDTTKVKAVVRDFGVVVDNKGAFGVDGLSTTARKENVLDNLKVGAGFIEGHNNKAAGAVLAQEEYGAKIKPSNSVTGVWVRAYVKLSDDLIVYSAPEYYETVSQYYTGGAPVGALTMDDLGTTKGIELNDLNKNAVSNDNDIAHNTRVTNDVMWGNGNNVVATPTINEVLNNNLGISYDNTNKKYAIEFTNTVLNTNRNYEFVAMGVVVDKNEALVKRETVTIHGTATTRFILADNADRQLILGNGYLEGKKTDGSKETYKARLTPNESKVVVARPYVTFKYEGNEITVYGEVRIQNCETAINPATGEALENN